MKESQTKTIAWPLQPRVREAIVDRFVAGDALYTLCWDYELTPSVVEECLREALKGKRRRKRSGRGTVGRTEGKT